ncbi:MAG: hydrolase TatD, partial [Myxococcales bacterium]|nr:hydrolase TatD [Myxococcales bacterium]
YPNTKMDQARMVALVQQYGTDRIIVNSAADWGVSDPLKVPKTAALMRERGIAEAAIETIFWSNPIAFFAQSGRLDAAEFGAAARVDQRQLWEGNSVLRGQTPIVNGAGS